MSQNSDNLSNWKAAKQLLANSSHILIRSCDFVFFSILISRAQRHLQISCRKTMIYCIPTSLIITNTPIIQKMNFRNLPQCSHLIRGTKFEKLCYRSSVNNVHILGHLTCSLLPPTHPCHCRFLLKPLQDCRNACHALW